MTELTAIQQIGKTLESGKMSEALEASLSGTGRSPDRFRRQALLAIQNAYDSKRKRNPLLEDVSRQSLYLAIQQAGSTGLDLDPSLGHMAIVPRGGTATVSVMYRGLIALALRSPKVAAIDFGRIHKNDKVEARRGTSPLLDISYNPLADRGEVVGFYCLTTWSDGALSFETLNKAEAQAHRQKHKGGMVWGADFDSMALKTVVRKEAKKWPIEVSSDSVDGGETAHADTGGGALRANKRETIDRLKFTLEGAGERIDGHALTDTAFVGCRIRRPIARRQT